MSLSPCTRGPDGTPCGSVPPEGQKPKRGHCLRCWRAKSPAKPQPVRVSLVIVRPVRCLHIGKRTEHKHGCGGMKCRWDCTQGLPAVPGIYCQTCVKYEPDAGPWV